MARNKGGNGLQPGQSGSSNTNLLPTTIEVTCPTCNETYNIRTSQHLYTRNCRCSRCSFEVHLAPGYGHVRVFFINGAGTRTEFENWRIIAQ
jgi:hypothetical protein